MGSNEPVQIVVQDASIVGLHVLPIDMIMHKMLKILDNYLDLLQLKLLGECCDRALLVKAKHNIGYFFKMFTDLH